MSFEFEQMPDSLLPIRQDNTTSQKAWTNYSLILNNPDVNVQKVNNWVRLDMGNSLMALNNIRDDLPKFEKFDTFDTSDINQVLIKKDIEEAFE